MSEKLKCTYTLCGEEATRVMACPMDDGVFVAPYCDAHPGRADAVPAAGPALSEQAQKIEGIR